MQYSLETGLWDIKQKTSQNEETRKTSDNNIKKVQKYNLIRHASLKS